MEGENKLKYCFLNTRSNMTFLVQVGTLLRARVLHARVLYRPPTADTASAGADSLRGDLSRAVVPASDVSGTPKVR